VAIASRLGITAAIATVAAAIFGGGYWWLQTRNPRETVKAEAGVKVDVEDMSFYGNGGDKVDGRVFRPAETLEQQLPAVIYCQSKDYGESWCRSLAGTGAVCYCFDFRGEGEKERVMELEAVLKGFRNLRYVDKDRIYLLGEANGCLTACTVTFDKSQKIKGLILVSPGFNPLEISRKAKRYKGTILVVDDARGRKANLGEIGNFLY